MADDVLRVTAGPATGGVISPGDVFTIGRAEGGVGALADDPEISRQHARISRSESGELVIEDLGSTNGTHVNGERISGPTALRDGDRISVGKTTLELSGGAEPVPPAAADIGAERTVLVKPPHPGAAPEPPAAAPEPPPLEPPAPPPPSPPMAQPPPLQPPTPEPAFEPASPAAEPPPAPPPPAEPVPEPPSEPQPVAAEPTPPQPVFDPGAATVLEPAPPELPPSERESEKPIPMHVLDYLRDQSTLTLAISGEEGPWAATLTYVNRGAEIYVWVRDDTVTAAALLGNPAVGYAIDEFAPGGQQVRGLQGRGVCSPLEGTDRTVAVDLFDDKFPDVRPTAGGDVTFYKLTPGTIEFHDTTPTAGQGAEYHTEAPHIAPYMD